MNTKNFIIGTVVGAITLFVLGYLIFELAFGDFYAANMGSATGLVKETPVMWASALGSVSYAVLLTLAILSRPGSVSIVGGFKVAAIVGFLVWFTVDFTFYGIFNLSNLTIAIVDPLLELVHAGVTGAIIAAVLGMLGGGQPASQAD